MEMAIYTGVVGDNRLAGGVWFHGYFNNAGAEPNDAPEPNEIACCRTDFHRYVDAGVACCCSDACTAYAHAGKLFIQQIL